MNSQIEAEELYRRIRLHEPLQIVDLRPGFQWAQGHIPGASPFSLEELESGRNGLDPAQPVVVYGDDGALAAGILERAGFGQILCLAGGFDAWRSCRFPEEISQPRMLRC